MRLRLQALQEADKHLGIPDHPWKPSEQVASRNSSHLDRGRDKQLRSKQSVT